MWDLSPPTRDGAPNLYIGNAESQSLESQRSPEDGCVDFVLLCWPWHVARGIFPSQGLNLGLLHCRQILYQLSHQGSHRALTPQLFIHWRLLNFKGVEERSHLEVMRIPILSFRHFLVFWQRENFT